MTFILEESSSGGNTEESGWKTRSQFTSIAQIMATTVPTDLNKVGIFV